MGDKIRPAARMEHIKLSAIRGIFDKVGVLERQGKKIIHMDIGRPDFDTPAHIKEAAIKAMEQGFVHYTATPGILELREAIARKLQRENGLEFDPAKEIIVTVGASEAIFISMISLLNPGDEVLVPEPMFVYYADWGELAGAKMIPVPLREKDGFRPRPEDIEKAVTSRTKMIAINSPHNPTGMVIDLATLQSIARIAIKHDLFVLSDEVYEKMVYDGARHHSIAGLPGMRERTLTINAFSKTYSMTGWRLGYVAADPKIAAALFKTHQHAVGCLVSFTQKGAVAALDGPQDCVDSMVKEFDRRRKLVVARLTEMPGVKVVKPEGAFYAFPSIKETGKTSQEVADYLLNEASVALVPGSAFGRSGEGYLRISYATSYEQLEEGLYKMESALAKL